MILPAAAPAEPLILASGSSTRARMLRSAGLQFQTVTPRIDEEAIRASLIAEAAKPRDIADVLAEAKARRVSSQRPDALVIGADQVLECKGALFSKPTSPQDAIGQLLSLGGHTHTLHAAVVLFVHGAPVWRHIGTASLAMHHLPEATLTRYVDRNWDSIQQCVGAYKIEEEGVQLFSRVEGDHFTILGLPLIELLSYLRLRGTLAE